VIPQCVSTKLGLFSIGAHIRLIHLDDWCPLLFIRIKIDIHLLAHNFLHIFIITIITLEWLDLFVKLELWCGYHGNFRLAIEFKARCCVCWLVFATYSSSCIYQRVIIFIVFAMCFSTLIIKIKNIWKVYLCFVGVFSASI